MSLTKIGGVIKVLRLVNKNGYLSRMPMRPAPALLRFSSIKASRTKQVEDDDEDLNRPIKFSTSEASEWTPARMEKEYDQPWYQLWLMLGSVSSFLIYFCVLREENDIDQKLGLELHEHFPESQKESIQRSYLIPLEYQKKQK